MSAQRGGTPCKDKYANNASNRKLGRAGKPCKKRRSSSSSTDTTLQKYRREEAALKDKLLAVREVIRQAQNEEEVLVGKLRQVQTKLDKKITNEPTAIRTPFGQHVIPPSPPRTAIADTPIPVVISVDSKDSTPILPPLLEAISDMISGSESSFVPSLSRSASPISVSSSSSEEYIPEQRRGRARHRSRSRSRSQSLDRSRSLSPSPQPWRLSRKRSVPKRSSKSSPQTRKITLEVYAHNDRSGRDIVDQKFTLVLSQDKLKQSLKEIIKKLWDIRKRIGKKEFEVEKDRVRYYIDEYDEDDEVEDDFDPWTWLSPNDTEPDKWQWYLIVDAEDPDAENIELEEGYGENSENAFIEAVIASGAMRFMHVPLDMDNDAVDEIFTEAIKLVAGDIESFISNSSLNLSRKSSRESPKRRSRNSSLNLSPQSSKESPKRRSQKKKKRLSGLAKDLADNMKQGEWTYLHRLLPLNVSLAEALRALSSHEGTHFERKNKMWRKL